MSLPDTLQKLPPEILGVFRHLGAAPQPETVAQMSAALNMHERAIMRSIRRLVNYFLIEYNSNGTYTVSSEGERLYQSLQEADTAAPASNRFATPIYYAKRQLTVVVPRGVIAGSPAVVVIGIDAPGGSSRLSEPVTVDLRVKALGGNVAPLMVSLTCPPDRPATPLRLSITATQSEKPLRLLIDAFQAFQVAELTEVGGMYVDIAVGGADLTARRAVTCTLSLRDDLL